MAQAARALWPGGRALAWRLGGRLAPGLAAQSRTGFAGAAGGPGPAATARKGSPRLLGAAALALGGAMGLYYTARWHLHAQNLRAKRSATQVSLGWTELLEGAVVSALNFGTSRKRQGRESPPQSAGDLGRVMVFVSVPSASSSVKWGRYRCLLTKIVVFVLKAFC